MARETANNGTSATSLDSAGGAATATKNNKKPSGKSAKSAMITNAAEAITLGITAIEQGDRDGANKIFNDTVTLDPNNAEAWVWLAGTSSDLDDAEAAFEKAYALDPNNEQASLGLRWVRLRRKVLRYRPAIVAMVGTMAQPTLRLLLIWGRLSRSSATIAAKRTLSARSSASIAARTCEGRQRLSPRHPTISSPSRSKTARPGI